MKYNGWKSRQMAKSLTKFLIILFAGCVLGLPSFGLDAGFDFIPQRFLLRAERLWQGVLGSDLPGINGNKLKPVRVEVERGVNLLLDPADYIPRTILISGSWQPKVGETISKWLTEDSVMLDVGAHIGYFTLKAGAIVGKEGKVIAFEPNPKTLKNLRSNIAASGATNIIVQPIACTDYEQIITLHDSTAGGNSGLSSFLPTTGQESYSEVLPSYSVRGRPIDDVVRELGLTRVDVVKVDVEGAETMVIRGARETLKLFHPVVVMEMSDSRLRDMGSSLEELAALMMELGYTDHRVIDPWDEDVKDWEWIAR